MKGHVKQRGKTWFYVVDLGEQVAQRCDAEACLRVVERRGKAATIRPLYWIENEKRKEACPDCAGPLRDVKERRQRWQGGHKTRKDAERALRDLLGQVDRGTYVEPLRQTVAEFLREWLEGIRVRPATAASYRMNVETRLIPLVGSVPVQRLTPQALDQAYRRLEREGGRKREGLSPRSVRYAHAVIHKALADAVRKGKLAHNPADRADPPKHRRADMKTWAAEQLRAFLEHVEREDPRHFGAWLLLATTGMRRGEALGLRWSDIDLEAARASIVQTVVLADAKPIVSQPKTEKGRRMISLDPVTVAALRAHKARQAEERLALGLGRQEPDGLVFAQPDGAVINPERFSGWFKQHARAAGQPRIRLHDLRHTYATLALAAGVPAKVVQERLGHSSIAITLDLYSHVMPALQEDAAARVASVIFGSA